MYKRDILFHKTNEIFSFHKANFSRGIAFQLLKGEQQ